MGLHRERFVFIVCECLFLASLFVFGIVIVIVIVKKSNFLPNHKVISIVN